MTDSKKSYYAVIPANVRYDATLPPNAKLLYGEITALCNAEGYCWASNKYFAELYDVSQFTISRWINALVSRGYIESRVVYKKGTKQIDKRYMQIRQYPIDEIRNTPIDEIRKENNTDINNTSNNTIEYIDRAQPLLQFIADKEKRFVPPTIEEVQTYCIERGNNVDAERFVAYYESNGWKVGKNKMKDWKAAVRTWEGNGYDKPKTPKEPKLDFSRWEV